MYRPQVEGSIEAGMGLDGIVPNIEIVGVDPWELVVDVQTDVVAKLEDVWISALAVKPLALGPLASRLVTAGAGMLERTVGAHTEMTDYMSVVEVSSNYRKVHR